MWSAQTRQPWSVRRRVAAFAGIAVVAAITAFFIAFDWNWLKSPIEKAVTSSTGRRFEIQGDLKGEWRLHPRFRMSGVRFANPEWSKNPLLLSADAIEIKIALWPLLKKRVHIHELTLERPSVFLERLKDGRATWLFDRDQRDEDTAPEIDVLRVDNGALQYHDALTNTRLSAKIQDKPTEKDARSLKFQVQGTFRSELLALQGETASLLSLKNAAERLPLAVNGTIAGTQISLNGEIEGLTRLSSINLRYAVKGPSLRRLAPVFGVPLPETPPYAVKGMLSRAAYRWETRNLKGKVGSSDIAANVVVTTGGTKPNLDVTLNSELLDLADLGPLIGAKTNAANTATKTANEAGTQRVMPTQAFDLSRINALDAHVTLKAKRVMRAADFPFDDFFADFRLNNAQIVIDPLEFGMADGKLRSKVTLDARQPTINSTVNGRMSGVRVAKIFPNQAALGNAAGTLSGFIDLQGRGNSISAMLATSTGRTTLLLADGRVPSLLPAIADLDGMRVLASYLGKKPESVRCAAIDLGMKQGIAVPNVAVFETDTTVLSVDGTIDMHDETLKLKILQAPKKPSFLSIRTPIMVTGTLKTPQYALDPAPLAVRGAAAVILALINPLAVAFALVETGPGNDGTCPEIQRGIKAGSTQTQSGK
ncbi:MAG TPA: AsmA family protein [Burkholderiales bacterium]|nr:AsmA family protein [Burkholderiales bacterium]